MKVVLQRVSNASVKVNDNIVGSINGGLLILLGIIDTDTDATIEWMCNKIINLRIFNDENGLMNKSVLDVQGELLVVSQFTLYGNAIKGNRPSFIEAAKPDIAIPIYEKFKDKIALLLGKPIASGIFGADMKVSLLNDGPVTLIIEK
jgi:D-aminoacyl-tRNA deacylase